MADNQIHPLRIARRLYEWVESLAQKKRAITALVIVSAAESIVFPIPPDVLLIPMAVARPSRALLYALICLVASVVGGIAGYWLGVVAMDSVGASIVGLYGLESGLEVLNRWYSDYGGWAVGVAGFTPIPYKLFTLTSGATGVSFPVFVVASIIGRGARFFLVGGLIYIYGDRAAAWIDRHFNTLTIILILLLLGVVGLSLL